MSSTGSYRKDGSKKERHNSDLYETPFMCVQKLLEQDEIFSKFPYGNILEPCAGNGKIIQSVNTFCQGKGFYDWTAIELLSECEPKLRSVLTDGVRANALYSSQDYLTWEAPQRYNAAIVNPPFLYWQEFLEKSLRECDIVMYLLRLGVLGSKKRHNFWQVHKPAIYVMSERPSFTDDGHTDSEYYAWMCWGIGEPGYWKVI